MSIGLLLGGGAQGLTAGINAGNSIMDRKRRDKRDAESDQRYQDSLTHRDSQEAQADSRYKAGIKYRDSNNDLNRARQKNIDAQNQKTAGLQQQVASNKLSAYQLAKETKAVENYMLAASRDGAGSVLKSTSRGKALMDQYGLEDFDIQGLDNADGSRGYHILGKPKGKDWSLLGANGQPLQGHEQSAPLSQAGLVAFTSHALGVSQEAVDAAFGNQQRLKLTSANENAKMDKVQAGKVEIANIKADGKRKTATSSEMRQLRKELGDSQSLSNVLSSTLDGESLPDNVIPFVKRQIEKHYNEGMSAEEIRQAVLADISPRLTSNSGTLYGKNFTFNTSTGISASPAKADQLTSHIDKVNRLLEGGPAALDKKPVAAHKKPIATKSPPIQRGISSVHPIKSPGVSKGVFNQHIENVRNGAKGYNDGVKLAREIRSGTGRFNDLSSKQKQQLINYAINGKAPGAS